MIYDGPIEAPIQKNQVIGKLKINFANEVQEFDLLAFEDVKRLNIFSRIFKSINYLIWGDV